MIVECLACKVQFDKKICEIKKTKNNFCSRSCAATFNNKGKRKNPPKERTCKTCKVTFFRNRRSSLLCKDCSVRYKDISNLYKSLTLKEYHEKVSVKGKHKSWANAHIRAFNRSWNKFLTTHPCQRCGYDKHIELAHIRAVTDFPETATLR